MSDDKPVTIQYELTSGALTILDDVLRRPGWYKDEPKFGSLVKRARSIRKRLPAPGKAPTKNEEESEEAFNARFEAWAATVHQFDWTDLEKEAAKKAFSFFLKLGAFEITDALIDLIRLFQLDND